MSQPDGLDMKFKGILPGLLVRANQLGEAGAPPWGQSLGICANRPTREGGSLLLALAAHGFRLGLPLLLLSALVLGAASFAQAAEKFCSEYGGMLDGDVLLVSPVQITIDETCTFQNWPKSNPLTTTINFQTNDPSIYLIVFDNVWYEGNMACANIPHKLWVVNSEEGSFSGTCQDIMIPAETIVKQAPATTASIGVPFTYKLTLPSMNYPAGATSPNDLGNVILTDDLNAMGVDLTVDGDPSVTWQGGAAVDPSTYTYSNAGGLLTFVLPNIPSGQQIVIEIPVVLANTPANAPGTQFINTAEWSFSRSIDLDENGIIEDGTFDADGDGLLEDEYFAPLPGESGISAAMTIVAPDLRVDKTSTTTNLNVGAAAPYEIDVANTGGSPAWNVEITDNIPGGMCQYDPRATVAAKIYAADGTMVSTLALNTDYTLGWTGGSTSACQLTLALQNTPAAKIEPNQHLVISYEARLDAGTLSGQTFTNVAGATRWFNADSSIASRFAYNHTLSADGTPGTYDFEDAHTVTSAVAGYYFLKSVENLTTGDYPAASAFPGDTLRYTLQLQNFTLPTLENITITDDLGALNTSAAFASGISIASSDLPATATVTPCASCGTNGAPAITITGLILATDQQYQVQFDVTLVSPLLGGIEVSNQALISGTVQGGGDSYTAATSDDPFANGPALLSDTTDGDATKVTIQAPGPLAKANPAGKTTATIGEQFTYTITVPAIPVAGPLYDVLVLDTLPQNLGYVSAAAHLASGTQSWLLTNVGSSVTDLILRETTTGIDIPAGDQAVIEVRVELLNTAPNQSGVTFSNHASYTYTRINGDSTTQETGPAGVSDTTPNMTVIEPLLTAAKTVGFVAPAGKPATDPATVGDVIEYTITVSNSGTATAFDATIIDLLPANLQLYGIPTAQINGVPVAGFVATPATSGGTLNWGNDNLDGSLDIPVNGTLVLTYQVQVLAVDGAPITNTAWAAWTSLEGGISGERTGLGCPTNVISPDNYCTAPASATPILTPDPTAFAKSVVSDSWSSAPSTSTDATLRVGDTVIYSLALTLREGVTQNVVVNDQLPAGLTFAGLVSITPASGSNFTYTAVSQPLAGSATPTWNLGNITNAIDNNPANNTLIIQYRARVMNTLAQLPTARMLTNNATLNYAINGVAATPKPASATINVWQPMLTVSKSAVSAGGDTTVGAGELITYTVNLTSNGTAPAYNPVLTDTLPVGLRQAGVTTTSITLVNAGTVLPLLNSPYFSYNGTTGVATWNFDTGVAGAYAIPPGETLRVVYQVTADGTLGAGMTLNNQALVQHYYSLDSQDPNGSSRKDYLATSPAIAQLTSLAPTALAKLALVTTAAIGQPFTYQITIPAIPQPTALFDVHVTDNLGLAATGVAMSYLRADAHLASGTQSWATLSNSGTPTNLDLSDLTNGLDVPANDQLVVNVTVVLGNDAVNNTLGKLFQNTASYTFESIDNNPATVMNGAPGTSGPITIVGPDLTVQKSGPSTAMRLGVPGTFTLNVQNTGGSTAWNATLTDLLPNVTSPAAGGMCGSAPANITAQIYQSDGVTAVSAPLVSGTDFTVSFAGAPACTWTVAMTSPAAAIPPTNRLILTYSASLDPDTASGLALTNMAGATQWLSADPTVMAAGNVQTYTGALTNGTPGVLDNQDAFTVTTQSPVLAFTKTVYNVTTGQSGANATPGDTLKYTLTIQNVSPLEAANFSLTDELDQLNTTPLFVPGSLALVTVPPGADTSLTLATGGTKGTGLVRIGNLNLDAQNGANDLLVIEFQARLVPVITSGTSVLNQGQIGGTALLTQLSDDPSLGGASDPTVTMITSAPTFRVLKTVQDLTSGTSTVQAGDTLRYTIKVNNLGTENAIDVTLRDPVPANTTYVANSTKLNEVAIADPSPGVSPLQNGLSINAPADPTAGTMPADAGAASANTATITFEVRVSTNVVDGTIISNQGLLGGSGAASGLFLERPSDDPATPVLNDPTAVVVGNLPLVYALKTVQLVVDNNANGNVDPGDVLQYTLTLTNSGATPATGVVLTDTVPANTTYVANSLVLNGAPVAQPDGGVSPLVNGIGVVSSGLPPPSPPASGGTLAAGGTGSVTFQVQVNPGVASGTIISNQGRVATGQLPTLLTDSDGNAGNGYQPTAVVVGDAQQLSITKSILVVGGGAALPGSVLEYTIQATNIGTVPATSVVITDDLTPLLAQAGYVANSATMNGYPNGVSFTAPVVTATYGTLAAGSSVIVRFQVILNSNLASGTVISNTAQVSWNSPAQTATADALVNVGGIPGSAILNGAVWQDANFDKLLDGIEPKLAGWAVELYRNSQLLATVDSGSDGSYQITGLLPNAGTTMQYELRFRAPGAGPNTAMLGWGDSIFTNGMQRISDIVAASGNSLQLNLPLTPNGVVYNSVTRTPVAGATLTMVQASTKLPLPGQCFADPLQQNQVTTLDGFYKFDLNFSEAACPAGSAYLLEVTPPPAGYMAMPSQIIPPASDATTAPFSVPACPGSGDDAVPTTAQYCEVTATESIPPLSVAPRTPGTLYHLHLTLSNGMVPGQSQLFNNALPVDPELAGAVAITKTAGLLNVTKGQLVPYTITVNNVLGVPLYDLGIVDHFPAGFKYVQGSARLDGVPREPTVNGRELLWGGLTLQTNAKHAIQLLLVVGAGVTEDKYVNRAQVLNTATGRAISGEATATVQVIPDPTFDCTDAIGKVFDDRNLDGQQDDGELGLAGVRVVTARGLLGTTDQHGRFHITCAVVPDADRGSNFILKLDARTLPTGYRVTTENPRVQRATRGKMLRFNFGATVHRVVAMDIADGAFEPESTELRLQWQPRVDLLLKELRKGPAVLRLSYLADVENEGLVQQRLKALKKAIVGQWDGGYQLTIETEVFWRRGSPP